MLEGVGLLNLNGIFHELIASLPQLYFLVTDFFIKLINFDPNWVSEGWCPLRLGVVTDGSIPSIVCRCFLIGAPSVQLHREWTYGLLQGLYDSFLFSILGLEAGHSLGHLTYLHSCLLFFLPHRSQSFFHLLVLRFVEILFILRLKHFELHLTDLFLECFEVLHELLLELILLFGLLL